MDYGDFGNYLKVLRKKNSATQNNLADALGVSPQAVSKWERLEGMPDISLIPKIALYFNITLDELFGMDKEVRKNKLQNVLLEHKKLIASGDIKKTLVHLRNAVIDFPHEYTLWAELISILSIGVNVSYSQARENALEAIFLSERYLNLDLPVQIRAKIIAAKVNAYKNLGDEQKAVEAANDLQCLDDTRSKGEILSNILTGEPQITIIQKQLTKYAVEFIKTTFFAAYNDVEIFEVSSECFGYTIEDRISILAKGVAIAKLMTESDDNYFYPTYIAYGLRGMAALACSIERYEQALGYLEEHVPYVINAYNISKEANEQTKYKSVLLNRQTLLDVDITFAKDAMDVDVFLDYLKLKGLGWESNQHLEPLKDEPRYIEVINKIETAKARII